MSSPNVQNCRDIPLVDLTLGPMGSGKTLHLIATLNRLSELGFSTLYINHKEDSRSQQAFSTNCKYPTKLLSQSAKADKLSDVDISDYQYIGIDEAQFFSDLPETLREWMKTGKTFYISGLDGSYQQKPIGRILEIIPLVTPGHLRKLSSICLDCRDEGKSVECGFTKRLTATSQEKEIGGLDKYRPVCFLHL